MKVIALTLLFSAAGMCGRPASDAPMSVGDVRDGDLTADDFDDTYGVVTDALPVFYEGGGPVAVVVTSQAMDPFAIVALSGSPVGADSGLAGGNGACVVLDAPHPLNVLVYVSSASKTLGEYRVAILDATDAVVAEHGCQQGAPTSPVPENETLTEVSHASSTPDRRRALTDS